MGVLGGGAQSKGSFHKKQLVFFAVWLVLVRLILKNEKWPTFLTLWWLNYMTNYDAYLEGNLCNKVSKLISSLLWFVAAIRTAYCPFTWIGTVRRRKGQCWAKDQRYSQNALCLPHTHALFHLFINTPSEHRLRRKTNATGTHLNHLTRRWDQASFCMSIQVFFLTVCVSGFREDTAHLN